MCASSQSGPFSTYNPLDTGRLFSVIVPRTCVGFVYDPIPLIFLEEDNEILLIHHSQARIFAEILDTINELILAFQPLFIRKSLKHFANGTQA